MTKIEAKDGHLLTVDTDRKKVKVVDEDGERELDYEPELEPRLLKRAGSEFSWVESDGIMTEITA